jgi:hypothetical protein
MFSKKERVFIPISTSCDSHCVMPGSLRKVAPKHGVVASCVVGMAIAAAGCAGHDLVRADDMSAAQHRNEAQREQAAADQEAARGQAAAPAPVPASDPQAFDPSEPRRRAEAAREHARQHESAAKFLEQFEDEACAGIPVSSRAACPLLGPLERLEDVPGGVRVTFADKSRVRTAIAEMRCHYAYARSRHFDENVGCPLYVKGIQVRQAVDPRAVEITAGDEATTKLIRQRSREQATFVRGRR